MHCIIGLRHRPRSLRSVWIFYPGERIAVFKTSIVPGKIYINFNYSLLWLARNPFLGRATWVNFRSISYLFISIITKSTVLQDFRFHNGRIASRFPCNCISDQSTCWCQSIGNKLTNRYVYWRSIYILHSKKGNVALAHVVARTWPIV